MASADFEVLHGLRIKGMAGERELGTVTGASEEDVAAALRQLAAAELVQQAPMEEPAWLLTPAGLEAHGERIAARRGEGSDGVAAAYDSFLELNDPAKRLVSRSQQAAIEEAELLMELEEIAERVGEALAYAARTEPRFGVYGVRFDTALAKIGEGDARYVGDPSLDSFHTVWFECHEDFLLTLGLSREE
ncbi:MAG TPA: hypothetical protein VGI73_10735 [Solirubrobacterales bacterium]|jgi:hypothetical protein